MVFFLPDFKYFSAIEVEDVVKKAVKHQAVILDLSRNGRGLVQTLKFMVGGFFDKEVKIADRVGRKQTGAETAKPSPGSHTGKRVVLFDAARLRKSPRAWSGWKKRGAFIRQGAQSGGGGV